MKDNAVSSRTREVADAVDALRRTIEERMPIPVTEPRGYVSQPARPRALELGLRLCVHAETGDSLAKRLRIVPAEYVDEDTIRCACGQVVARTADRLERCSGCDRFFCSDDSGTWAVKLPEAVEPDAA